MPHRIPSYLYKRKSFNFKKMLFSFYNLRLYIIYIDIDDIDIDIAIDIDIII